jgi:hypothetical protein
VFLLFTTMMNARFVLAVFLAIIAVAVVNCDFIEAEFEAKKKDNNVFVLFVKDM